MSHEEKWFRVLGDAIDSVPSIYYLWSKAQQYVDANDVANISRYENLIMLLRNSAVSPHCKLGKDVKFGYGGIGVVLHKDALICDGVVIGQNVTIGGATGKFRVDHNNSRLYVPLINEDVYLAAGSKILGGIEIGHFVVIGANSVVTKNLEPYSVYAGTPARKIVSLNKGNALRYKAYFHRYKKESNEKFVERFPD
jgi:serine O-acetyltransferase